MILTETVHSIKNYVRSMRTCGYGTVVFMFVHYTLFFKHIAFKSCTLLSKLYTSVIWYRERIIYFIMTISKICELY